jgi:hypothetical protein
MDEGWYNNTASLGGHGEGDGRKRKRREGGYCFVEELLMS